MSYHCKVKHCTFALLKKCPRKVIRIPVCIVLYCSLLLVLSLAARGFSPGTPVFPSHQKPTFPNSNSTRNQIDEEPLRGCATSKSLFIIHYSLLLAYQLSTFSHCPQVFASVISQSAGPFHRLPVGYKLQGVKVKRTDKISLGVFSQR